MALAEDRGAPSSLVPTSPGPTHLESCPGLAATSLRTWLIHLGPVCLAASPRSWIPADLFFIRAIPHHCLLLPGPGFINLIVLLFRFLGFFYRHPSLRSTRPSFLVLIPITSSCSIRSPPLIPFGVLQRYTNLPSHTLLWTPRLLSTPALISITNARKPCNNQSSSTTTTISWTSTYNQQQPICN